MSTEATKADMLPEIKARGWRWTTGDVDWLIAEVTRLRVAASIVEKVAPYITDTFTGRLLLTTAWLDDFTNPEIDYLGRSAAVVETPEGENQ